MAKVETLNTKAIKFSPVSSKRHPSIWGFVMQGRRPCKSHFSFLSGRPSGGTEGRLENWRWRKWYASAIACCASPHPTTFFISASPWGQFPAAGNAPHAQSQPHYASSKISAVVGSSPSSDTRSQLPGTLSSKILGSETPNCLCSPGTGSCFLYVLALCHLRVLFCPLSLQILF